MHHAGQKVLIQRKHGLAAVVFSVSVSAARAVSPCDGVDRSLTVEHRSAWAPEIAKQLSVSSVDVLQSFRVDGWNIIYVDTHQSDEVFIFYARDPLTSHYITSWSGAAASNEEETIKDWTLKNAPNIPLKLASCFAWHVTKDRDK
jgi:hypothetical protein